ncbi:MAG: hypothetical protein PWP37_1491 [Thermotogota bacterium]|nr:hypothetical protein [Thermotogota bacterium]MDK2865299.1 hypothetical protein [Thermotogota bacterium]
MTRVVLSDLHVGDGGWRDDFELDQEFATLLEELDRRYADVELILNGDVFEIVKSNKMKSVNLGSFDIKKLEPDPEIIEQIKKAHPLFFQSLSDFARKHRVVYIAGNHDFYLLTSQKLREKLWEALSAEIPVVSHLYLEEWQLLIIHGNQFDVTSRPSFDKKQKKVIPPISEYLARYMMIHFDDVLSSYEVPEEVLKDYDNVNPKLDTVKWLDHVTKNYNLGLDLVETWMKLLFDAIRSSITREWIRINYPFTRFLSKLFINRFGGMKLGEQIVRFVTFLQSVKRSDSLFKKVKRVLSTSKCMPVFKKKEIVGLEDSLLDLTSDKLSGIILGHSHKSDYRLFRGSGRLKFYVNTGTWAPVVEAFSDRKGFYRRNKSSYAILSDCKGSLTVELCHILKSEVVI